MGVPRDLSAGQILPLVMAAVVIGGLLQILFGILKLGKYITLVPYSVVSGFMSGIGVIIIALQIGPLLKEEFVQQKDLLELLRQLNLQLLQRQ